MRLHRLQITAFGPFADTVEIDFDELTENGLFLLHGPTGAGKTSVLDAVCYALYASVPGARQEAKRLRSDHAAENAAPEVTLEFTARGRRFEVTRSPEWRRPVKRGTGTTREPARSMLREKVDGEWLEGTRDHKETALQITALLGMKVEQFTRVVMLPQGDFANFLKAESRQRAELLQQLFVTDRFSRIETQLADRHSDAEDAVTGLRDAVDELVARTRQAAEGAGETAPGAGNAADGVVHADEAADPGPGDPTELPKRGDLGAARTYIGTVREQLAGILSRARPAADETASGLAAARRARDDLEARVARHARLDELERDQQQFDDARAERDADRDALAKHRRAVGARSRLDLFDTAKAGLDESRRALKAAEDAAGRTADETLSSDIDAVRAELVRLADLRAEEKNYTERRSLADASAKRMADQTKLRDDDSASHDELSTRRSELTASRDGLRDLAAGAAALDAEARRAESALAAARTADTLRADLQEAEQALRSATDDAQRRRDEYLDVRERRLSSMASELSADLEDDRPCPVCGSTSHPAPAVRSADAIDSSAEKEAEAVAAAADEARRRASDAVSNTRERLSEAMARAGDADTDAALHHRDEAVQRQQASTDAQARLRQLTDEITAADTELERLAEAIRTRNDAIAETGRERHDLDRQNQRFEDKRNSIVGETPVDEAIQTATTRVEALEALQSAAAAVRADRERAESARRKAEEAADAAQFAGLDAVRAALLNERDEDDARTRQDDARERAAELRTRAGEPDLVAAARERLDGTTAPTDVEREAAEKRLAVADASHRAAIERRAVVDKALNAVTSIKAEFDDATVSADSVLDHYNLTYRLSELARGRTGNDLRMSLSTYVLAARLEAVADAASSRLLVMSEGRYSIRHTDTRAGHGRLSGLGLEVLDAHTGMSRDPRTLSGGESFQASLALALGLADVVQAESGGVDLETLFIDEGFGSLDEQSLELVLDTLDGLRAGGRAVGVISHVREMKDRIVSSIEIEKTPHGSRVGAVRVG
ncbi:AAA family ATPase [Spelaeicoccus albus]|uniref:Nuclease SbcCD subunit C n=1 Tax=Spelaeicoccus albus TaxID=1280376 RepID=A0A7Z0IIH1_9MICO|nr:SMC family ATPase [Spelaeicoccus albus]NYI68362.1 exonuclease SbcC [Spelaeicoccus albus]